MSTLQHQLSGGALYLFAQMVRRSCRFQVEGRDRWEEALAGERPLLVASWHGMTMMLVGYFSQRLDPANVTLPIPDDWRGETLYIFASRMGANAFRLNLSGDATMGTARRLVQLVREVKAGRICYISPDGPHGPAYAPKPGVAYIAQKAGGQILPMGAYARHAYHLPRWDRYTLPLPFSRISIHVGEPIIVEKGEELTAVLPTLTNRLHHVTAQAAANYYEKAP
jgi:hypothetical protein